MTRIKICGITESRHILVASQLGVDFVGMVFASSPREISPQKAQEIVQTAAEMKPRPSMVGVFVNLKPDEVNNIADYCGLDWVQLSGNETWDYCRLIEKPLIKVIKVDSLVLSANLRDELIRGQRSLNKEKLIFLLDTKESGGYGGSGKSFDWSLIPALSEELPVFIAGGLNHRNVSSLIMEKHPWGVDVSSGVETDGSKDASLITAFVKEVRKNELK
jgi:phosphoribosylanthranilate isomerase